MILFYVVSGAIILGLLAVHWQQHKQNQRDDEQWRIAQERLRKLNQPSYYQRLQQITDPPMFWAMTACASPDLLRIAPGAMWPVTNHNDVRRL